MAPQFNPLREITYVDCRYESMETAKRILLTVIIPALHRPDLTRCCIAFLREQTVPADCFEIVVVENAAQPETSLSNNSSSNLRVIQLTDNLGTTGSINRGLLESSSKYVLLLNNDVELDTSYLSILLSFLENNERYGFAIGKLVNASDRRSLDGAGDGALAGGGAYRLGHNDVDAGQYDSSHWVLSACGAAALYRRSVLQKVGGLDEDFFAYLDDIDLGLRAHLLGYSGIYIPTAVAFHKGSATLGSNFHPKIAEWLTRNQILLIAKDYPMPVLAKLLPRIAVFQLLWFGSAIIRGRLMSYVKGALGAVRLLPPMLRKRRWLMQRQRISNAEFLAAVLESEKQVYNWHKSQPRSARSSLLKAYFWVFGR